MVGSDGGSGHRAEQPFLALAALRDHDPEIVELRVKLTFEQNRQLEQQQEFDRVRQALQTELSFRAERLEARERDLASRFARFHEFLEYPFEDMHAEKSSGQLQKLSEQDRSVRQLLEAEAERVYEKFAATVTPLTTKWM